MADVPVPFEATLPRMPQREPGTCFVCSQPSLSAICVGCEPDVEAARRQRQAAELTERRRELLAAARASVPVKWRQRRLQGGEPPLHAFLMRRLRETDPKAAADIIERAMRQVRDADADTWIVVVGPGGVGKTSLASAIALSRVDEGERNPDGPFGLQARGFRFISVPELGKARRQHRLGTPEPAVIGEAEEAPLVLLDDVGAQEGGGEDPATAQVLGARFRAREAALATIVTTFLTPDEAHDRFGDGITRRLFEESIVIDLHPDGMP